MGQSAAIALAQSVFGKRHKTLPPGTTGTLISKQSRTPTALPTA
jgi:hypothetical protein